MVSFHSPHSPPSPQHVRGIRTHRIIEEEIKHMWPVCHRTDSAAVELCGAPQHPSSASASPGARWHCSWGTQLNRVCWPPLNGHPSSRCAGVRGCPFQAVWLERSLLMTIGDFTPMRSHRLFLNRFSCRAKKKSPSPSKQPLSPGTQRV